MKDSNNIELNEGDLTMYSIDTPTQHPAELIIYLSNEEIITHVDIDDDNDPDASTTVVTNTVKYYPITDEGLEVAKFDAGVTQNNFHRQEKYNLTNMEPRHILKVDTFTLRGHQKTLYDSIIALL